MFWKSVCICVCGVSGEREYFFAIFVLCTNSSFAVRYMNINDTWCIEKITKIFWENVINIFISIWNLQLYKFNIPPEMSLQDFSYYLKMWSFSQLHLFENRKWKKLFWNTDTIRLHNQNISWEIKEHYDKLQSHWILTQR